MVDRAFVCSIFARNINYEAYPDPVSSICNATLDRRSIIRAMFSLATLMDALSIENQVTEPTLVVDHVYKY